MFLLIKKEFGCIKIVLPNLFFTFDSKLFGSYDTVVEDARLVFKSNEIQVASLDEAKKVFADFNVKINSLKNNCDCTNIEQRKIMDEVKKYKAIANLKCK